MQLLPVRDMRAAVPGHVPPGVPAGHLVQQLAFELQ